MVFAHSVYNPLLKSGKLSAIPICMLKIRRTVDDFLERTGMPPARFGKDAIGNDKVVLSLRRGKDVRSGTAEQIYSFIADYWSKHPDHENHPDREAAQ